MTTISSMGIKNGCSPLAWNPIQHSLCNRIQSDGIFENPMKSPKEKLKLLGGSEIIYIINSNNTIQKKDGTSWTRPDWVGLAHEMFHSYHQLKHSYSFQSEKEEDKTVNDTDLLIQEKIDAKIDINLTLRGTY